MTTRAEGQLAVGREPADGSRLGYRPALDGLRAVAAILVVLFHARVGFVNGALGVDVFFVLSGFLITGILLPSAQGSGIRFTSFYVRRARRLLPAYFAVLVASVVAEIVLDTGGTLRGAAFSSAYVSNWAVAAGQGLGLLAHTWSLSIEEQFYVLWPLCLALLTRRFTTSRRLRAAVAVLVLASYLGILGCYLSGVSVAITWNSTFSRAFELLIGCYLAVALQGRYRRGSGARTGRWITVLGTASLAGIVAVANLDVTSAWLEILVQWPLVSGLTVAVIVACVVPAASLTNRILALPPLVEVGKRSYGLYLWHFPVFVIIDTEIGLGGLLPALLGISVSAILVWFSYRFIEQPFLRRKLPPADNPVARS